MREIIDRIKKILQKKSIKNGTWMYVMQIFNTVIPLFTVPYVTRVLGKSQYGIFSIALNIIGYLQVLIEYGFTMSATRKVAATENDTQKLSQIFSNVIYSRCILYVISVIISFGYIYINRNDVVLCNCVLALLLCLFGYVLQQNWLFQGMQDMKYISIINIIGRSISVLLIFATVKVPEDIVKYTILYSFSPLLSGIIGLIKTIRKYRLKFLKPRLASIKNALISGFYVFTTQLSSKVFGAIGITFLGIFGTASEVGAFSAIQKISTLIIMAWSPLGLVIYPISSKRMLNGFLPGIGFIKKIRKYILATFSVGVLLVCIFSSFIVNIAFGPDYIEYSFWVVPLALWTLVSINNNFLGTQILLAAGYDKEYSKTFQIGVAFTIGINMFLVYKFKGTGASVSPLISDVILGILLYKVIKKIEKREKYDSRN